jgi:hypothetical protein
MKITNKYNLPEPLLIAHDQQREAYASGRGDARLTVSQLIGAPRVRMLREEHDDKIEDDISQRTWAMVGTALHKMLEEACRDSNTHLSEERIEIELGGWKISGQIDVQVVGNQCQILDWKFTSSWKYRLQEYSDWEQQLNAYCYLIRKAKGWDVVSLDVTMFVRDFMNGLAKSTEGYPPAPAIMVNIPLWSEAKQEEFLLNRISVHKDAARAKAWGQELPLCTDEERWKRDSDWAARKPDNKRAAKVGTKKEVDDWLKDRDDKADYILEEREDKPTRCIDNYCSVNEWCSQWQKEKDKWTPKTS